MATSFAAKRLQTKAAFSAVTAYELNINSFSLLDFFIDRENFMYTLFPIDLLNYYLKKTFDLAMCIKSKFI